ncbi:MAG TPA: hypothetical protein VF831_12470 [Anaerolineales bacterium]
MNFGYVLKRAWEIIWKFKILWIFGILASCGQASGSSGSNSSYRFSGNDVSPRIQEFFNQNPGLTTTLIILGIILAIVLVILAILLGTVGRVGLIRGTVKAEQGADRLTFGELWRDGLTYFWRVFGLNLLLWVIIFVAVVILGLLAIILTIGTIGIFLICLIPLLCLIVPIMWFISIIVEQANVALVVENLSITQAIERGWKVVRDNIGNMIVMGLILIVGVSLIGGFIIGLPLLIVAIPAVAGIATGTSDAVRNGLILSGLFFIIYLPFLLLFSGILRAYISSAWTLTYLRLTNKPMPQPVAAALPPEAPMAPEIPEAPMAPEPPAPPEPPLPPTG